MLIIYICIFFLGASLASFLNATTYRVDNKYKYPDIIKSSSHCEKCKHQLTWWELFPILGYILIKGKCTSCGEKVNPYYPLSELFLGSSFLLWYLNSISWYMWIILLFLFVFSYHDIKYKAVPKTLVHIFLGVCVLFFLVFSFNITNTYIPVITVSVLLLMNLFKKSFGMGDILLLLGSGILLSSYQYISMFLLSISIALLYSLIWVVIKKIDIKKAKVPMVPFFTTSFVISAVYGEQIFNFLLKYLSIW
jgi:prepilin signal peptidase PulO-like enzyme (type II secretory pathway)